VNGQPS